MTMKFDALLCEMRKTDASPRRRKVITFDQYANIAEVLTAFAVPEWASTSPNFTYSLASEYSTQWGNRKILNVTQRAANGSLVHTGQSDYVELPIYLSYNSGLLQDLNIQLNEAVRITATFAINRVTAYPGDDADPSRRDMQYNQRDDWTGRAPFFWFGDRDTTEGMPLLVQQYTDYTGATCWTNTASSYVYPMTVSYETRMTQGKLPGGPDEWCNGRFAPWVVAPICWRENQLQLKILEFVVEVL